VKRPIAYVMEQTLGSVTHYLNLRQEEDALEGDRPQWLPIPFTHGRVPWTIGGGISARRALRSVLPDVDGVFIHTNTLAPLSADLFGRVPAVISTDGTPYNKRAMRTAYDLKEQSRLAELAKRSVYSAVFKRAAGFVAWSSWAAQSFIEDYGCPEAHVRVIPPGINSKAFAPGDRSHELPRLLFVGGDFRRKGGDLLLDVFRRRLRGRAELSLVTKPGVAAEPGVTVHTNVTANSPELHRLYATSDIFVLPTRADCYPLVCMEALAAALPMVATRVGGIPDLVKEGQTGHLVDVNDAEALGDRLESLVADRDRRAAMGAASRAYAAERFDSRTNARALFEFVRSRCPAA
jgi:glycosyltransferase involved in cell wall biosynthesis